MTKPYKILISDPIHQIGWDLLQQTQEVTLVGPMKSQSEALAAVGDVDAIIIHSETVIDNDLLAAAPRLRVIARAGARLDNVDIENATRRGIFVINVPEATVTAVVEHTFTILLALARRLPRGLSAVKAQDFPEKSLMGFELQGKTIGVIGFGRIGREVAARAHAFGMSVLAYDPYIDLAFARERGVEAVNFTELLKRADIVSLHTTLTPQTREVINDHALRMMKPGSYLVNCADAKLIDETALSKALINGHVAGAALDTLEQIPPPSDHPLVDHPNVILTPHLAQNTVETETTIATQIAVDTLAALRGEDFRHIVNLPFTEKNTYKSMKTILHLAKKLGKLHGQLAEGRITRVEVEVFGEGLGGLVRPVAAALLTGMLLPVDERPVNWVSAPVLAYEQGITLAQAKSLVHLDDYPMYIACRIYWANQGAEGQIQHRTVAGVLFGTGEARLLQYNAFQVDAKPEGYVLILENMDVPGVIGKVGTRLGKAGININQWRYGQDPSGKWAVSFINLDKRPTKKLLTELESEPEISHARLVRL